MKKKIIIILSILLIGVAGFFGYKKYAQYVEDQKPLIVITEDEVSIDITKKINPNDYLTNIKENVELSYVLDEENSLLTITAKQGEKEEVYQKEVTIVYPTIEVQDDIVYDVYTKDFDINSVVDVSDNATIDYEVNEETGEMTITITDGEYIKTITKEVEVIDTNPYPIKIYFVSTLLDDDYDIMTLYEDGTYSDIFQNTQMEETGPWYYSNDNHTEITYQIFGEYRVLVLRDDGTWYREKNGMTNIGMNHGIGTVIN